MKKRTRAIPAAVAALPKSYLALLGEFPLRPISGDAEYDRAAAIVHRLALLEGSVDAGEEAYLAVLEALIEQYDRSHFDFVTGAITPTRLLNMLVEQAGMSVTELGKLLGSKGAASRNCLAASGRNPVSRRSESSVCGLGWMHRHSWLHGGAGRALRNLITIQPSRFLRP
jgi:antitoxin component HigA of HigAB toxin-antitoxin module